MPTDKKYKYPFIPKDIYPAVMYACKLMRENGHAIHWSSNIAAKYYGVSADVIEKHIRARQGAGQKAANEKRSPRKFSFYSVVGISNWENGDPWNERRIWGNEPLSEIMEGLKIKIVRASNDKKAEEQAYSYVMESNDGYHSFERWFDVCTMKKFATKKEAEAYKWSQEEIETAVKKTFPDYRPELTPEQIEMRNSGRNPFYELIHDMEERSSKAK
jgi:hypothetical protein